jgi:hypothetical protein
MTATARRLDHALPRVEMRSPALIARQEATMRAQRLMPHPNDVLPFLATRWGGLTLLQCAVLYIVGFLADADGVFRMPASKIYHHIGRGSEMRCASIPHDLVRFGLLEDAGIDRATGIVRHYAITRLGWSVLAEIAGREDA